MIPSIENSNTVNGASEPPLHSAPRMPKRPRISRKKAIIFSLLIALGLIEVGLIIWKISQPDSTNSAATQAQKNDARSLQAMFNKSQYSVNRAASIWVVVNKGRALPSSYVPANLVVPEIPLRTSASSSEMHLRQDTAVAMEDMFKAATEQGINLRLASGYRSYNEQIAVYGNEVKNYGQATADRESARPGHSEHQTGLAADLEPLNRNCEVANCFADTPEGKWLAANSYKYGFIIRYPKDGEELTGYKYEPWHVRFVGIPLAAQIHKTGQTLEQFFGLATYTDYPLNSYQLR